MVPNATRIINWARLHIGVHEIPPSSNDGPALREMLKETNFEPGDKWCMFFAEAAIKAGFDGIGPIPHWITHTGSCAMQAGLAKNVGRLSRDAATGAVVLFKNASGAFHHAGIVTEIDLKNRRIKSIQGNTNGAGSFNGGEVMEKWNPALGVMFVIW
jgi:hypothetical protein